MRLLIDTHVLLWWLADSDRLSPLHRDLISDGSNEAFVSAVSIAEISIKKSLGKLDAPDGIAEVVSGSGLDFLDLQPSHAQALSNLPWHHRDPFDRMLVAQAMIEKMVLLSVDPRIAQYDVPTR